MECEQADGLHVQPTELKSDFIIRTVQEGSTKRGPKS